LFAAGQGQRKGGDGNEGMNIKMKQRVSLFGGGWDKAISDEEKKWASARIEKARKGLPTCRRGGMFEQFHSGKKRSMKEA